MSLSPQEALERLVVHTAMDDAAVALECEAVLKPLLSFLPQGWRLVPVEPTEEMMEAGSATIEMEDHDDSEVCDIMYPRRIYRAMISAAPIPDPSNGGGE